MTNALTRRDTLRTLALGTAAMAVTTRRARAAAPPTVNIGYFVETKPTVIGKGTGWIEEGLGAKVNWTEMGSATEINAAIAAGSCDIGLGSGSAGTAAGISQRIPLQLIGMVDNIGPAEEMTVRKSANIKTPADFKGKKVATPFGSTSHFRLLGFLKLNNLTQRDVTVLDMRPDAIMAAWQRGDIDASYVWSPAKSKMIADGGEVFRTWDTLDKAGYVIADLIVARTAFAEQYPDAVTGLLKAYGRSLDLWKNKPDEAVQVVAKQAGVSPEMALADLKEYDFVTLRDQLSPEWLGAPGKGGKLADVLKRSADFLVEQRSIRSAPSVDAFKAATHTEYLVKALA